MVIGVFQKMKNILCNKSLSLNVRKRVLKCYTEPVLLYGSESWNVNEQIRKNLEATEMWFPRRMLRIPWIARVTNIDCLKEANETRQLYTTIRKRQTAFFGHVMRRGALENIVTTGKIEGKRGRGRPREMMLDGLRRWHGGISSAELIQNTKDRDLWRDMNAYASWHGT